MAGNLFGFRQVSAGSVSASTTVATASIGSASKLLVYNGGSGLAYVTVGTSATTASSASVPLPSGSAIVLDSFNTTNLSAITTSGSASLTFANGDGEPYFVVAGSGGSGGAVTVSSGSISLVPTTSGGLSVSSVIMSTTTNATLVSSAACQVYKIEVFNNSANIGYLKLYNLSSAPTAGSSLVVARYLVPGSASGAGMITTTDMGDAYSTGLGYTFTGGILDSDTTAITSSNAFIVNIHYK